MKKKYENIGLAINFVGGIHDGMQLINVKHGEDVVWVDGESSKEYRQVFVPADAIPSGTQFLTKQQIKYKQEEPKN